MNSTCRSCKAPIIWARTKKGRDIPLDAKPSPQGNMAFVEGVDHAGNQTRLAVQRKAAPMQAALGLEVLYMPHHATCPQGKEWRR